MPLFYILTDTARATTCHRMSHTITTHYVHALLRIPITHTGQRSRQHHSWWRPIHPDEGSFTETTYYHRFEHPRTSTPGRNSATHTISASNRTFLCPHKACSSSQFMPTIILLTVDRRPHRRLHHNWYCTPSISDRLGGYLPSRYHDYADLTTPPPPISPPTQTLIHL